MSSHYHCICKETIAYGAVAELPKPSTALHILCTLSADKDTTTTMSLIFHWVPYSTATGTAAILDELEHGLSAPLAQRVQHSFESGDLKSAEYLAINPCGRVPAIVHDGTPIFESAAITTYLGETFGVVRRDADGKDLESLYPALGPQRGEAMKWIIWSNVALAEAGIRLLATLGIGANAAPLALSEEEKVKQAQAAKKDLRHWLGVLNGALEGKEYLLGAKYSLVDTHVNSFVTWVSRLGADLEGFENVRGWMERVASRPALSGRLGSGEELSSAMRARREGGKPANV